jgi:Fe-S-cluster containining protein
MDIPLDVPQALFLIHQGEKVGIKNLICRVHPKIEEKVLICKQETRGDIAIQECVFFLDGKCSIYEDRPDICRIYGTEFMRCRYECVGIHLSEDIEDLTIEDLQNLDKISLEKSKIKDMIERIII